MGEKDLLKRIEREAGKDSLFLSKMAIALEYASKNTIWAWVKKGKIPRRELENVEIYFENLKRG